MKQKKLGTTPLLVSPLGLGLAALGRPGYINLGHADDLQRSYEVAAMETRAHEVLDAAWQAGIRYFDAARSYGRSEHFLLSWLIHRRILPGSVTVASKWGYTYTADWQIEAERHEIKDHSLNLLRSQFAESKSLLGNHLCLYQIHSATLESGVLDNCAVLEELGKMRQTGLKIGLTLSGPRQAATLERALSIVVDKERVFDTVQATWNLLEPSAGPMLQQAHLEGMGVIIKEAMANGRLTTRNQQPAFAERRRVLEEEANRLHTTPEMLPLAAVLAQPWVDVVLSGAATVEHVHANVAAGDISWDEQAEARLRVIKEDPLDYWNERGRLAWN